MVQKLEEEIFAAMHKLISTGSYESVFVVEVDYAYKYVTDSLSVNGGTFDQALFSDEEFDDILIRLSSGKKALVLKDRYGMNGSQMLQNSLYEVLDPYYSPDSTLAGFIYLTKKETAGGTFDFNAEYPEALKEIVLLAEKRYFFVHNEANLYNTIVLLAEVSNARQPQMMGCLYTIFNWAKKIAEQMKLSERDIRKLQLAVMMHDLGKFYINDTILNKPEKLTQAEYDILKVLTTYSYEIACRISKIYDLEDIPHIILHCQEHIDGTGYPNGAQGEDIPLLSRIIHISKALQMMLSNTPNRKALPIEEIIEEIRANSGRQFDGELSQIAISLLLYKKNDFKDIFEGIGNYSTLSIVLADDEQINIWGSIRRYPNRYEFNPSEFLPDIQLNQIVQINIYINMDDRILKYKPEIQNIYSDKLIITRLYSQNDEKVFSISWNCDGVFITPHKNSYPVNVITVGGDFVDFYTFRDNISEPLRIGAVGLELFEKDIIYLPGVIVFEQTMFEKTYYRFEYRNMTENDQKELFSAIFRKQLQMKKRATRGNPGRHGYKPI